MEVVEVRRRRNEAGVWCNTGSNVSGLIPSALRNLLDHDALLAVELQSCLARQPNDSDPLTVLERWHPVSRSSDIAKHEHGLLAKEPPVERFSGGGLI